MDDKIGERLRTVLEKISEYCSHKYEQRDKFLEHKAKEYRKAGDKETTEYVWAIKI